ncbi:glycosyltransferase [Candidatus Falkowbacteria bacterium]|nr:glycosyltransferase [Candidatus Falkowbacteria bacterium]
MSKVFVSIATYNEKENIGNLIRDIFSLDVPELSVVVIDDNSPDGTAQIVENLKNSFPDLHLIKRSGKLGYGSAHVAGFKYGLDHGAEILISMDADFSHDPKVIPRMIEEIKNGSDVVVGSRKIPGVELVGWGFFRKFASAGAMLASQVILGIKTNDLTSGFRAYHKKVFAKIDIARIKSDGYSFLEELIYLIEKTGLKIKETPIRFLDRRLGYSKLSKMEIIKFFVTIFRIRLASLKNFEFNLENAVFVFLVVSFFIGIWHAFPLLKVIGDEMYFVGGVLRAMENLTIMPAPDDVPYGTVTYYLNYFLIAVVLAIFLPFFGFSVSGLKEFLVQSPELLYFVPRLLSVSLSIGLLILFGKIFKKEFGDYRVRIFLMLLLFTNMITVLFLHTGKMWVSSVFFVLLSFYYLYRSLIYKDDFTQKALVSRGIFLSVLFSFLALVNFPMNAFSLVNIPVILWVFKGRRDILKKTFNYIAVSSAVFILIALSNFEGIKNQLISIFVDYDPVVGNITDQVPGLGLFGALLINIKKLIVFFPLFLLTLLLVVRDKIKNIYLFWLGVLYFFGYWLALVAVGTWSNDIYEYIRRLLPIGFLLTLIIAGFNIKFKKVFYIFILISLVYFGLTLYYLALPTTYNLGSDWIIKNLNKEKITLINEVRDLDLPKNKESYLIVQPYYCSSKCENVISGDLNQGFKPLIVDKYTKEDYQISAEREIYYISLEQKDGANFELWREINNGVEHTYSLDGRMANYFDWEFFKIKNFGPDIYIYKSL